jgi:hypothetical protein
MNKERRRMRLAFTRLVFAAIVGANACATSGSLITADPSVPPIILTMPADREWVDSGMTAQRDERLFISATGELFWNASNRTSGPDGINGYPGWTIGAGGLVGRVEGTSKTFDIGARTQKFLSRNLRFHSYHDPPPIRMPVSGRLQLGFKDFKPGEGRGEFEVTIRRVR